LGAAKPQKGRMQMSGIDVGGGTQGGCYRLFLDKAGAVPAGYSGSLTVEIGACETWEQLHWMAKGAAPFERGFRLYARSPNGTVLSMADMDSPREPGMPEGFTRCPRCHGKTCVIVDGVCWECMRVTRGYVSEDMAANVAALEQMVEAEQGGQS